MKRYLVVFTLTTAAVVFGAVVVPTDIQQPGTQPGEVSNIESPDKCDNCHGGYNRTVEPAFNWRGSMMAQATRDPIFWATVAVAEQDFDGAGDLCIRCHSADGWINGRSVPTDGSGLGQNDASGVACDLCHKLTNPDDSELLGEQFPPFVANDEQIPATGYYGSGMYVLWGAADKLGPYPDAEARHQFRQSRFHRSIDLCGTCHDVSNPAVGDLAPNHGAQVPLAPGTYSGVLGGPVEQKAAFNNFPYQYGVVERTFSEYKAGLLSRTLVSAYATLPVELQAGAIRFAYEQAMATGAGGDYADHTPRYFSCQSCHMPPVTGLGCNKAGAPTRTDLPLHDMTGGNYWMPDAIQYLDLQGKLRLGGGLTTIEIDALNIGKSRALETLSRAASLAVTGNTLRVVNLTGHKLISGYPEGRRMWLNIRWYDGNDVLLREDGAYGPMAVAPFTAVVNGLPTTVSQVETILDQEDPNTKIYEAHYAITQEWAAGLLPLFPADLPLSYDRETGAVTHWLSQLAAGAPGSNEKTFHFVLNNHVDKDNRIPPYRMSYDEAKKRNALPVPANQYGVPPEPIPAGAWYDHWDDFELNPPAGAVYAMIDLLYQPTSWEYIQFLYLANTGANAFLANEGAYLLEAWLSTGMARPHTMASTAWGTPPAPLCNDNGACDAGEDCINCPSDCISGGGDAACGNGLCEPFAGEDCLNCRSDCNGQQKGKNQFCCGAGGGTNPVGCADPRCTTVGFACSAAPLDPYCCGDGVCGGAEDPCTCAVDCGPGCERVGCNGNGTCEPGEDCLNCPNDCMGVTAGQPASRYCCGNGVPEPPESDGGVCDGNY